MCSCHAYERNSTRHKLAIAPSPSLPNLPVPSAAIAGILGWSVHHHLVTVESLILRILIGTPASLSTISSASAPVAATTTRAVAVLLAEPVGSILDHRVRSTMETTLSIGLLPEVVKGRLRAEATVARIRGPSRLPAHRKNPAIGLCIAVSLKSGRMIVTIA